LGPLKRPQRWAALTLSAPQGEDEEEAIVCYFVLKLLEKLEIYWKLKSFLEILEISWNLIAVIGDFFNRSMIND